VTTAQTKPTKPNIKTKTAIEWLSYIEALHPKSIAMGLDRVKAVAEKLQLNPTFPIITVAGTNGKGSVCAMLSHIYHQAGYKVGCYTSPHLNYYNERVSVNLQHISDGDLCSAFEAVEVARGVVQLTSFEMGTLAAMWHFCHQNLDVCILEVGLGGRLDAVNVFEPSCTIVTTVDLDHMEFLGETREKIGFEKAGIFRKDTLAICGDDSPPVSLIDYAQKIGANLALIGRDFQVKKTQQGWHYLAENINLALPLLGLFGDFQLNNAACAIRAVQYLNHLLPTTEVSIHAALAEVKLIGRFQEVQSAPSVILDVAHNPHAAKSLAQNLRNLSCAGRTLAVFAMLADKDIDGVVSEVKNEIDAWYLADIHIARGAKAQDLHIVLQKIFMEHADKNPIYLFDDVGSALETACKDAHINDRIIVFGSFYTVADAIANG
jgi:dihydrofolate synthase / folylpolyglutamate synthase